jgi:hypothetical protein
LPSDPESRPTSNPSAVWALIFGFIGLSPLAIIFGFIGRARARAVGRGKAVATFGLVLGVLWLAGQVGYLGIVKRSEVMDLVRQHTSSSAKAADPGCTSVENSQAVATMDADARAGNMTKLVTDFRALATTVTAAQATTGKPAAATAMKAFAADLTAYANSMSKGGVMTPADIDKFVADAAAVDKACSS